MPPREDIQRMFTGIAGRYDRLNHLLSFGMDFHWWRRMAQVAGAAPGKLFLDVAAGTGDSSMALAKRGAEVVSTDFTHAMLKLGPSKFRQRHLDGRIWASVDADACRLPFQDATFDGLTICYGIRNVEDRPAAYREFLRVLKPGGQLTVLEFSHPIWIFCHVYGAYIRWILPWVGAHLSGDPMAYAYLPESILKFPTQRKLACELEQAGFSKVKWINLSCGITALHTGTRPVVPSLEVLRKAVFIFPHRLRP